MACPNKNLPGWKDLVAKVGEYEAMSLFLRNGNSTPNIVRDLKIPKSGIVSMSQKINILKRLAPYNSKLDTAHTLNFIPTGEYYEGKVEHTYVTTINENWKRDKSDQLSLFQDTADKTQERNERIEDKMRVFLQNIGVEYTAVKEITDKDGNPLGFAAKADMLNKVVEVVEDRAGIDTLPEEAAHFFVNILESQGDPLYSAMYKNIDKYKIYDKVVQNPNYEGYSEEKFKKEAIGKAIAKHIINKDETDEFSENISRLERWWTRILNKIKRFFKFPTADPYTKAALSILNNEVRHNSADLITEEQIELGDYYQDSPQDRQANIIGLLDETEQDLEIRQMPNEDLQEIIKSTIDLPEGKTTPRYYSKSKGSFSAGRVSDAYQERLIKQRGIDRVRDMNRRPANEHKRTWGVAHHTTMQNLVDHFSKDWSGQSEARKRNYKRVKTSAVVGNIEGGRRVMTESQFNILEVNVKKILKEIKDTQKQINKETGTKGEVVIRAESTVQARVGEKGKYHDDTAGTLDLLAVFSDGSASIYDWKFISPRQTAGHGQSRRIMENPFRSKEDGYNMNMSAYKSILKNFYNVKKVRRSRIVPVHVQYKWEGRPGEKALSPIIDTLKMAFDIKIETKDGKKVYVPIAGDSYLKHIPVAGELTGKKGLDKILNEKLQRKVVLKSKLEAEKNAEKRQSLNYKIDKLDIAIKKIQLEGDLSDLFSDAGATIKELNERLPITDKEDPNYIHNEEFLDFYKEISRVYLLTSDSTQYLKSLGDTKKDKALKKKLEAALKAYSVSIAQMYDELKRARADRVFEIGDAAGLGDITIAQKEFGVSSWFQQSASHTHPIFQAGRHYINIANNKTRLAEKKVYEECDALRKDLVSEFGSVNRAYKILINPETGNLYPRFKKEFWERKQQAVEEQDSKWMKKHYKLKKDAKERYEKNKKRAFAHIERNFKDYDALYEGQELKTPRKSQEHTRKILKAAWENRNNIKNDSMWTSSSAYIYTELREKVLKENYSEEYKEIKNNKSLFNVYKYYEKKNKEFAELTGLKFADNFVANIHQDIIDSASQEGFANLGLLKKSLQALQVRQDDITPESIDEDGRLIKSIPLLYTNPGTLIDPETGKIDVTLKSRDLLNSIQKMATTVYNYVEKSKIESINLLLLDYLQENGTPAISTDTSGGVIKTVTGKLAEIKTEAEAANHFERIINAELYGQMIQSKDKTFDLGGKRYSMNKMVRVAKTWYSAEKLGFALLPAAAALIVGKLNIWIQAKKGIAFTVENLRDSQKDLFKDYKTFTAINNYFEIWQEDMAQRRALKLSSGMLARWVNLDTLFLPLRKADNMLDNMILNSMMRNYGADENGMPKRLSQLPEGSKSLRETFKVDETKGTVVTGLSEEGEINFREKVKFESGSVKGSMHHDTTMPADTTLIGSMLMHFKGFAPRLLQERFGGFRWNPILEVYDDGRYNVATSELMATEKKGLEAFKEIATRFGRWARETATFGAWKGMEMNEKEAEKAYERIKVENPHDPKIQEMKKEEYYEMRRAQLRAMGAELKGILATALVILALSREGDDGEPIATKTWATRKLQMVLMKAKLELMFTLNPMDWMQMFTSPIPLMGLAVELMSAMGNFVDESWDLINGIDNRKDRTPFGYYTFRLFPGFTQLSRVLELYETDKRNPYDQKRK